ncbi:INO80 complex subunit E isoform X2 [Protopterus annectens]|uniref:INO80 complex subunit E isoform X2 n=1 Tax=Protopterus annectens TaxID=7888 RepID=UPI001CFB5A9E|nr:INO80 complex subunit E isoform X2 [Protopterus annectens]
MKLQVMNGQPETEVDYKRKYRNLKRKLKFLIYEQECFQEELRRAQRKLLKVSRDKSFLLDRLLQYENIEEDSSDSDATASSEISDTEGSKIPETPPLKKKKSPQLGRTPSPSSSSLSLQTSPGFPLQHTGTPSSSYLSTMSSPPSSQFPTDYWAPAARAAVGASGSGAKPERPKKEKKLKMAKPKKLKLQMPSLPSSGHQEHVGMSFSPPSRPLSSLSSSKLPPTTILSTVPQQMFSDGGEGSEDDALEGDDDLVIDIPE